MVTQFRFAKLKTSNLIGRAYNWQIMNTDITYDFGDRLSDLLATDDMLRLICCIRSTRFSIHRRLYLRTVALAQDLIARKLARSQFRQWLKCSDLEQQVFTAIDNLAESIETQANPDLIGSDHAQMIDDIFLLEVLDKVEGFTGIDDPVDPITDACCRVVFQILGGLPVADLSERLAQINSERAQLKYFKGKKISVSLV